MDGRVDSLGSMLGDPQSLTVFGLVFAVVFIVVAVAGLHLMKPPKIIDGKPREKGHRRASISRPQARPVGAERARPSDAGAELKRTLYAVQRALAFILVGSLAALTIGSYFATDPDDGSRLLTIVLAAGTLILGHHLHRMDRRIRPAAADDAPQGGPAFNIRAELASKMGAALLGDAKVELKIASPEVYSIDQVTLDRARAMAAEGHAMDEICRTISPEYDGWGAAHQQAYQSVVRAAIEHDG